MALPQAESERSSEQSVRVLQVITFAMLAGVLLFFAFSLFENRFAIDGEPGVLSWIGLFLGAAMFLMHLVVPGVVRSGLLRAIGTSGAANRDEATQFATLFPAYQTGHVVACAMLEGAAFVNAFAYLSTPHYGSLIAVVALITLLAIRFPTLHSVQTWVHAQGGRIADP